MIYLKFLISNFLCCTFTVMLSDVASEEVLVTIPQGTLRGKKEISVLGHVYYSFQDIPYGKPTIGELRFQPPQPAENWTGIRDATKAVNVCPGYDLVTLSYAETSSEDCLFVHVYTKEIPKPGKKYPVLVWIHGGGFFSGNGNKNIFSPEYFMSHDIVFVSINYRLGALGFLSLQTLDYPGNMGLKDQQLAFKWIQDNIAYFGGDPHKVTLYGESAGASSVHHHLLSPSSKGLFHGAICSSSAATNFWAYQTRPREYAYVLGKLLGYNGKNDKELLNFLKKCSTKDIVEKSSEILAELKEKKDHGNIVSCVFVPTIEPEHEGAITTKHPLAGDYQNDVPLIIGNAEKEMLLEIYRQELVPKWKEDKEFQGVFPRGFPVEKDSEKAIDIARKIRQYYFKDGMTMDGYINVLSDAYFNYGVYRAIKHRLSNKKIKSPSYLYLYSFDGNGGVIRNFIKMVKRIQVTAKGAGHADELSYFFRIESLNITVTPGTPEHKTILRLTQFWVNFATLGVPTNNKSEITWPPLKQSDGVYLNIGKDLKLGKGLFKERMEFWDEIYKLVGKDY